MKEHHNFRKLKVWDMSMKLAKKVYLITRNFPKEETYGLRTQLRRSAVSIPSNIAEGCGRGSRVEFKRFISIARGSSNELETQLRLAYEFNYINQQEYSITSELVDEILKMTYALIRKE